MLGINSGYKIYLCTGATDMRKGINGLTLLAQELLAERFGQEALFVFRGRRADRVKLLWWDGQGYCLFYKCLERGKFTWPQASSGVSVSITQGQLSMLIEGIDWRQPCWSSPPYYG